MSTNGIIAKPQGDGYLGRYHHADSYPSGLGRGLWRAYHGHFQRDVAAMITYLVDDHPAGWSYILGSGTAEDCDWTAKPQWIRGTDFGRKMRREDHRYVYLTQQPICYCHGDQSRNMGDSPFTPENTHEWCWVYVLGDRGMTILSGKTVVVFVRWDHPEPDWGALDEQPMEACAA